eukprot:scaffold2025_cov386-Prasinococcus_capsulatus_cf.AAC.3
MGVELVRVTHTISCTGPAILLDAGPVLFSILFFSVKKVTNNKPHQHRPRRGATQTTASPPAHVLSRFAAAAPCLLLEDAAVRDDDLVLGLFPASSLLRGARLDELEHLLALHQLPEDHVLPVQPRQLCKRGQQEGPSRQTPSWKYRRSARGDSQVQPLKVMKNWEVLEFFPLFPMASSPRRSSFTFRPSLSSLNFFPQMLSPPAGHAPSERSCHLQMAGSGAGAGCLRTAAVAVHEVTALRNEVANHAVEAAALVVERLAALPLALHHTTRP